MAGDTHSAGGPNPHLWSRDGFLGANAAALRADYTPHFTSVAGNHAPHRLNLFDIAARDSEDSYALPTPVLSSSKGVTVSLSRRRSATPFAQRNAEADEVHFVQSGRVRFMTDFGDIEAGPLDFVYLPKAITFRIEPLSDDLLTVIVESPERLDFDTPAPFGMINFSKNVRRPELPKTYDDRPAPHILLIKAFDGTTRFEMMHDPLRAMAHIGGTAPVWALSLRDILPISYGDKGGPPAQFMSTADTGVMLYSLSARPGGRPPVHVNADYDEIVLYADGPGAWGKISQPGTITWVPKGISHHGPSEDVKGGYQAWLLEVRPTMRLSPAAREHAAVAETGEYGFHVQP